MKQRKRPIKIKATEPLSVGTQRYEKGVEFVAPFAIAHMLCRGKRAQYVNEADAKTDPGPGSKCGPSKNKLFGPEDFKGARSSRAVAKVPNPHYTG